MLGKLFKHEFKATGKVLLPLNLVLVLVTILGMIIIGLSMYSHVNMAIAGVAFLLLYILAVIALFIVTYVLLLMRFYKSMYSDQGYLTHTLPVTPMALLNTKLLTAVFWMFLNMLLSVVSILVLIATAFSSVQTLSFHTIITTIEQTAGISFAGVILTILFFMILTCFSSLLMVYASISIGQLFNKYKILAAVITYIILYIIMQVVSTITMLVSSFHGYVSGSVATTTMIESGSTLLSVNGSLFTITITQSVIFTIIFYAISAYIGHKHVNLD